MSPSASVLHLATLDWVVIFAFVAAILGLGFSTRLRKSTALQFLVAGRSLTLPVFVATLVSTWYGGILGVGESVSYYGLGTWILLGVPYYVFALLYALVFAKKVRGAEQISIPERLEWRWGKGVAILGAILVFLLAVPAAHVLMLGVLVSSATGWDQLTSLLIGTAVGTAFLYKGGLLADVRVGMLAFVMMFVGFIVMVLWCVVHHPLVTTFSQIENKDLLTFTGGNGLPVLVSFMILGSWTLVDPGFHQRVASAASPEIGKRGVLVSIGFWFLFDVLSITTGMYALALMKPLPAGLQIFPQFGDMVLPPGLKAVFFCGMLGTIVSAMVGYTLVSGATVGRELIARIKGDAEDAHIKLWTRIGFVVACLLALVLAKNIPSVVDLWYSWGGCIIGALLVPVCLAYLPSGRRQVPANWMFAAISLSFLASLAWLIVGVRTGNAFNEVSWVKVSGSWQFVVPPIPEKWSGNQSITYGLGTLLPALVISGLIAALGAFASGRKVNHG